MELIGTIDKKFVVDGNTIKVAVTIAASKEVLSFIKDVAGMRCDMYVDARYPEKPSPAETPDDDQESMFDQDGNPIVPPETGDPEGEDEVEEALYEGKEEDSDAIEDEPQEVEQS